MTFKIIFINLMFVFLFLYQNRFQHRNTVNVGRLNIKVKYLKDTDNIH